MTCEALVTKSRLSYNSFQQVCKFLFLKRTFVKTNRNLIGEFLKLMQGHSQTIETKAKSKIYHILSDVNQLVLNCKRFRGFHIFDRSLMISSHRIPPIAILCIFIRAIHQVYHLARGKV